MAFYKGLHPKIHQKLHGAILIPEAFAPKTQEETRISEFQDWQPYMWGQSSVWKPPHQLKQLVWRRKYQGGKTLSPHAFLAKDPKSTYTHKLARQFVPDCLKCSKIEVAGPLKASPLTKQHHLYIWIPTHLMNIRYKGSAIFIISVWGFEKVQWERFWRSLNSSATKPYSNIQFLASLSTVSFLPSTSHAAARSAAPDLRSAGRTRSLKPFPIAGS